MARGAGRSRGRGRAGRDDQVPAGGGVAGRGGGQGAAGVGVDGAVAGDEMTGGVAQAEQRDQGQGEVISDPASGG